MNVNEQDKVWIELWFDAQNLSALEADVLCQKALIEPDNVDFRVQLLGYYSRYEGNKLKHANADRKLADQVLWFIQNPQFISPFISSRVSITGHSFSPGTFALLRAAWLDCVQVTSDNALVLGTAAEFIGWCDLETASGLFESTYQLQPDANWLQTYVINLYVCWLTAPALYKTEYAERIIEVGCRSLATEQGGAPFIVAQYVGDVAISLRRRDVLVICARALSDWFDGCDPFDPDFM